MRTRTRRRGRSSSRAAPTVVPAAPPVPGYPRGTPLTDSVVLTDDAGSSWLVYVEPSPPEATFRRSAAVLPGRRLRFDSLERSLVVSPSPAGSPFLPDARLHRLLAAARPVPPAPSAAGRGLVRSRALRSVDWAASVAGAGAAVQDFAARQWKATAGVRRTCIHRLVQLVAPAAMLLVVMWEALLARPRARI
jgi:hypothetical protein